VNSKREDALNDLRERLSKISIENGFVTDAGKAIFMGDAPQLGPNDPWAAIAVIVGPDSPETTGGLVRTTVPIEVQAIVRAELEDAVMAAEAVIADIKRAVEIEGIDAHRSRSLKGTLPLGLERGQTTWLRRQDGSTFAGAGITYNASFEERWGQP
jgi:hypothetical protein